MLNQSSLFADTRRFLSQHIDTFAQELQRWGDDVDESEMEVLREKVTVDYLSFHAQVDRRIEALERVGVVGVSAESFFDAFLDGLATLGSLPLSCGSRQRELETARFLLEQVDKNLCKIDRKLYAMEVEYFCE